MSWQEELNKKLEAQRAAYKESIESGEAFSRSQSYKGKIGHSNPESKKRILEGLKKGASNGGKKGGKVSGKITGPTRGKIQGRKNVDSGLLDKVRDIEAISKAAKRDSKKRVESGKWKHVQEAGQKTVQSKIECPHCNKIGQYTNMKRWHFDNCKKKGTI